MQTPHAPPQTRLSVGLTTIKPLRGMGRGRRDGSEEKMEEQREEKAQGPHRVFVLSLFALSANPKLLPFVATMFLASTKSYLFCCFDWD